MYEDFTQERVAQLRIRHGSTARDMSLSLGQNDTYINKIENKKALPSLQGLFYICEYFGITPQEFFDEGNSNPERLKEIIAEAKSLDDESLGYLLGIIKKMKGKQ